MEQRTNQPNKAASAAAHDPAGVTGSGRVETEIRKRPTQARGIATFNAILDAAARLLQEYGPGALTTNRIADRAGVNIATLYQYFPGKESILLELFRRDAEARVDATLHVFDGGTTDGAWREKLAQAIDNAVEHRKQQPGAAALRDAMRSVMELQVHERETLIGAARAGADLLVRRTGMDAAQAFVIALCAAEAQTALLDLWSLGHAGGLHFRDDRVIDELKTMLSSYLSGVIQPGG